MSDRARSETRNLLQNTLDASPFTQFLGLELTALDASETRITLRMPLRPELERIRESEQFQGGAVATLIDTAGVYVLLASRGLAAPTIHLGVDYLRPAVGVALDATATVRRSGRSVSVVDVEVTDTEGRLCAIGRITYGTADGVAQPIPNP